MNPEEIKSALAEPFAADEIEWKPQVVKGNRAMAIAYIDARAVMDRLDAVAGVGNWQDEYAVLGEHSVSCKLSVKIGDEWICKMDVGSESEQPDSGDRMKAGFSDALKRAAVKFGIGRYLYRLPSQWHDYDPTKKQFVGTPSLPAWALPKGAKQAPAKPAQKTPESNGKPEESTLDKLAKFLDGNPSVAKLNEALAKLPTLSEGDKKVAWDSFKAYAVKAKLEWDAGTKTFAKPQPVKS